MWSTWNTCTVTCGGGEQTRMRACDGGNMCNGSNSETQVCNSNVCEGNSSRDIDINQNGPNEVYSRPGHRTSVKNHQSSP